jgi:malonyl-CoA O-methyltransferase
MNHQRSVAARFSAAAATYDSHAAIQNEAAEKVIELIKSLPVRGRVLEVGCGTGVLTERLVVNLPDAFINAIDVSPAMIRMAQIRLAGNGRVMWIVGDIDSVRQGRPFDLVASSSSLHWITPLGAAFKNLHSILAEDGYLIFSLMTAGTLAELHSARERVAPDKQVSTKLPSSGEVMNALKDSGFQVISEQKHVSKQEFTSASELLRHLHEQGLTGGRFSSGGAPLNRSELGRLVSDYDSNCRSANGRVFATYEVLYVVAKKTGVRA